MKEPAIIGIHNGIIAANDVEILPNAFVNKPAMLFPKPILHPLHKVPIVNIVFG